VKLSKESSVFRLLTEIGIIEQLARNQLERDLPDGLKVSQFIVLNHLVRMGGEWSPARLANALQVTKGAMTNTLNRLEKRGLVGVKADPRDGRAKRVTLTDAGKEMLAQCVKSVSPLLVDLSQEVSNNELSTVIPILEKVRIYLDTHR